PPITYTAALSLRDALPIFDGVRRVATMRWDRSAGDDGESLRKMFMAIAADVRVVIVALALRLRDMRGLRLRYPGSGGDGERRRIDRKSTRLNSSHVKISYA